MGDFNEILSSDEHSGFGSGSLPTSLNGMRDFEEVARYCRFSDLGYSGPRLTWCNKRVEGLICKKLDRLLVNDIWLNQYPRSYGVFEAGGCSDHLRCRFYLDVEDNRRRKPFKFTNVVATMPEFMPIVDAAWKEHEPLFHSTSALYRFSKRLKALKNPLRILSKEKLGDLCKRAKEAYKILCEKQEKTLTDPSLGNIQAEVEALNRWQRISEIEEKFLKQKSKLHWLKVGDKNNKAFHNAAKLRQSHNAIREIRCSSGVVVDTAEEIKAEAERFFHDFLTHIPPDYTGISVEALEELMEFKCSDHDKEMLGKQVSAEEVKDVLFKMPNDKSPGPDGYSSEFFKASWAVLGTDFTVAVQSFFLKGFLPKGLNSTILALIPKKDDVTEMKDYRPISLCNVLYKVISKILANRIKGMLPKFISWNQSAFVKDRLLVENVLLASELVKDYHKESISPRCAMQIDISKAFDSVQWDFLLNVLSAMAFPDNFIKWIRLCISTASFSVQVNGELAGFFRSERGLRQGCALSPYLFVICINVLSKLLDKAAISRQFGYHPKCQNIGLTHLCFADDLMVFTDGTKKSVEGVLQVFTDFATISGLKISLEKSKLFMAGVTLIHQAELLQTFPFDAAQLPVRYLGLPLLTKSMTINDYLPLVERIRKRMSSWTGRFLSYAGRMQLIQSVIMSMVNFWLTAFKLPGSCLKEIERLCSNFLWSGPDLQSSKAKISWKDVCKTKEEGGLGFRPLKEVNTVMNLKLIWRILSEQQSLWVKWIKVYLIRKGSFWSLKDKSTNGSWGWRKILKTRDLAKQFHKMEIRNGHLTSFWYDSWSDLGRLRDLLGDRGSIDMGISDSSTVGEVLERHRRRRHRTSLLMDIEDAIDKLRSRVLIDAEDVPLWRHTSNRYKKAFSTKATWMQFRVQHDVCDWSKGVWYKHNTPRYAFLLWVTMNDRLSTGDRMSKWNLNIDTRCVLCVGHQETRAHLFFECSYTNHIWKQLVGGLIPQDYTSEWQGVVQLISGNSLEKTVLFLVRYSLQTAVHSIWRERNSRRQGNELQTHQQLTRFIEKAVRNRLMSIQAEDKSLNSGYQKWISSRV